MLKRNLIMASTVLFVVCSILLFNGLFSKNKATQTYTSELVQKPNIGIKLEHLGENLVPPTNHWFSGVALNAKQFAIYPTPIAFKPSMVGFSMCLPVVNSTTKTIFGEFTPDVTINLGSDNYKVTRYDDISVTITYYAQTTPIYEVTLAEGSPFVSIKSLKTQSLQLQQFQPDNDKIAHYSVGTTKYMLYAEQGLKNSSDTMHIDAGQSFVVFPEPSEFASSISSVTKFINPLKSIKTSYDVNDNHTKTTLSYLSSNGKETLYVAPENQEVNGSSEIVGVYSTIYGKQKVYAGTNFSYETKSINSSQELNLSNLKEDAKKELLASLKVDVGGLRFDSTDTYYGGKELYRAANLYSIALQLDDIETANLLKKQITTVLDQWLLSNKKTLSNDRFFYYDTTAKGIVGEKSSFGSDEFNDHHFHYGYIIYSAAVMVTHDSSLRKKYSPMLDLLVADLASSTSTDRFPRYRVFDPYWGHSWASGFSAFEDGNNQESASEASNAWNAIARWAIVTNNENLKKQATWMLTLESQSLFRDWLTPNVGQFPAYSSINVGINWGGKRDHLTFFSPEESAVLGIQLIPMNPAQINLLRAHRADNLYSTVSSILNESSGQFKDYLLLYQSLAGNADAILRIKALNANEIDNANSKTYMLAAVYAL